MQPQGQGASPDDAIAIDDFHDLYASAAEQFYREQPAETGIRYPDDKFFEPDLNCRWVKISGHFRARGYYHYRGVLAESSRDLYLNGGPDNFIRERLYFIENWDDPSTSSILLNGSDVTIVGRFYDLCRAARKAQKDAGEEWFIMGGPCHYGQLTGLMIRDARVMETANPFQRLQGEKNRQIVGNLTQLPKSWPEYEVVHDAAKKWVRAVREGAEPYYRDQSSKSSIKGDLADDLLKRNLEDNDDWIWFLATSPQSPILRKQPKLERQPFAIFIYDRLLLREDEDEITGVTACFCTLRKCDESWPLMDGDVNNFFDSYVCTSLRRDRADKTKWTW